MATWTQADVDALKAAVATGVLSVRYDGPPARQITYHSLGEMRALLASMQQEVTRSSGGRTHRFAATSKGF